MDALKVIQKHLKGTTHRAMAKGCRLSHGYFYGILQRQFRASFPAARAIAEQIFPQDVAKQGELILALQSLEPTGKPQRKQREAARA